MKWYFALNESAPNFAPIADMIKVAVHSAQRHTSLVPFFLYDGQESALTDWLCKRGVTIIPCRSFLYQRLRDLAEERNAPHVLSIGAGAFLRTEIPSLASKMGIDDKFVLYTDCDVMFLADVSDYLENAAPRYFAVAPEAQPTDYVHMNSGVMLMNLRGLGAEDRKFREFMVKHLDALTRVAWDQTAYTWYYSPVIRFLLSVGVPDRRIGRLHKRKLSLRPKWDKLAIEYNWKPYWEADFSAAKIVHFHGPKPYEREVLNLEDTPESLRHLKSLARGSYHELCALWNEVLAEADANNKLR